MLRTISKVAVIAAAAALAVTGVAEAKSYKVNVQGHGSNTGVDLKSTYKGSPFGTCQMTGKLVIPNTEQNWKCKGGSFQITGFGTTGAANDSKGTWKVKKGSGTGKYKGISGGGTFSGKLSTGIYRYVGKVKY
jgi:hypothetical protein